MKKHAHGTVPRGMASAAPEAWPHSSLRLAAWLVLLLVMVAGGFERYYVTGWNTPVLAVTAVVLGILFTAGVLESPPVRLQPPVNEKGTGRFRSTWPVWIETLVHYLPLILFLAVGPTLPAMTHLATRGYPTGDAGATRTIPSPGGPLSVSLFDLHVSHLRLDGQPIEVIGTGHLLSEAERKALPPGAAQREIRAVLYRYVITCCAADATAVSAVLNGVDPQAIREDQWYRIRGQSHYVAETLNVPFITVGTIEPIAPPHNPYLSGTDELFR